MNQQRRGYSLRVSYVHVPINLRDWDPRASYRAGWVSMLELTVGSQRHRAAEASHPIPHTPKNYTEFVLKNSNTICNSQSPNG